MRAVCVTGLTGPSDLQAVDIEAPVRGPDETLVEVRAVAPAFPDLLMTQGKYQVKPDLPFSPGSDFAGVVVEASDSTEFSPGDRVAGCLSYGAAAEFLSVPNDRLYPLPAAMPFADGAAIPMNYLTAHFSLVTRGGLAPGDWVMVLGASGGVGLASIQVAAGLGARVIAVVSSAERAAAALKAGAHHAVLRNEVPGTVRDLTGGRGVDIVVDVVGGDMTNALRALAPFGRVMVVGFASGEIPTVKVNRLLLTNTDVRGVESDYLWQQGLSRKAWDELMTLAEAGYIKPTVREGGSLNDYGPALERLSARSVVGRIVLSLS
ncbi:NADPH:quinone oxidoreductase family protein [Arthrobacter sp. I2-34]|uniref:NADPH:quinone oxidoreductase family protein n=1 Tax=Arthrobacter hankyongi TaxID=2904801 RepID=A0ABS9L5J6_9MICC|nr:NADPH:quinone oxidoreductase family protein [Arthrobacter hankyongi]MCG2621853.1 NADPH:quinone oxidoreductase family protein [Arthrobacter hankyongi]